jgi:HlyD family secretion protein
MDREIPKEVRQKARRKSVLRAGLVAAAAVAVIFAFGKIFEASISLDGLQTGVVDRGEIAISVNATGKVVPLDEEMIISPISARILEVYKLPGDSVRVGEPLLRLDISQIENEYRNMLDDEEIRVSKLERSKLTLENSLFEMNSNLQIKEMQFKLLYSDLQNEKYLDSLGASTADKVRRTELAYEEARMTLEQQRQKADLEKRNVAADIKVQEIELRMFRQTVQEKAKLLKDAQIRSPKTAILTFVSGQIGSQVGQGAQIATVADLSRFKIDCEIADGYRDKLSLGAKAVIEVGHTKVRGTVTTITPSITNGVIQFTVIPDVAAEGIRSGLTANVHVLHGLRDDVPRIPNSNLFAYGAGKYSVFVVQGKKAVKREITLGESSFEYVEVLSGLEQGEVVILSKLDKYEDKAEVKIKE